MTDRQVIEKLSENRLWKGDFQNYRSISFARYGLAKDIARIVGCNPGQVERIIVKSPLANYPNPKWSPAARKKTVEAAVNAVVGSPQPKTTRRVIRWNTTRPEIDDNKLIALAVRHDMGLPFPMIWLGQNAGKQDDKVLLALLQLYKKSTGKNRRDKCTTMLM